MSILVIEPNKEDRLDLVKVLQENGYQEVLAPASSDDGLALLGLKVDSVRSVFGLNLVVLDISNPESIDVVDELRSSPYYADIPIMVTAAGERDEQLARAFASGAYDFIQKPIPSFEFIARVRSCIRFKSEVDSRKARERELIEVTNSLSDLNKLLSRMSLIDSLTAVGNRRAFDNTIDEEWRRAVRSKQPVSLIMLDIDFFKYYNDTYGHQAGDQCLKNIATIVNAQLKRPGDFFGRYGGEEFALILPNTETAGAKVVADMIIGAIGEARMPHRASRVADHVTCSLGISSIQGSEATSKDLLVKRADEALYDAKKSGRNRYAIRTGDSNSNSDDEAS